jgi:Uma2 family endonuclease
MGEAARQSPISVDDYLEGEKTAEIRHEYVDGEVFSMVGTTKTHNLIMGNLYSLLRTALSDRPCRVYMAEVKVHISTKTTERFYYPDLHAECEPFTEDSYFSEHPALIVEVLSDSTERGDRSDKFYAYRKLPSLQEYVLIAQDETRVEVYRRSTNWELEVFGTNDIFPLESVGSKVPVTAVYDGV